MLLSTLSPEILVSALQDRIPCDQGRSRLAKSFKFKPGKTMHPHWKNLQTLDELVNAVLQNCFALGMTFDCIKGFSEDDIEESFKDDLLDCLHRAIEISKSKH